MNTAEVKEIITSRKGYEISPKNMEQEFKHQEIARKLAKTMAEKANESELRRLYEETMFQQFISMEKSELSELLWHG